MVAQLDFSFKGYNASSYYFVARKIIKPPLPRQEEFLINIPKIQGLTQLYKKFSSKLIQIRGELYASSDAILTTRIQGLGRFLYSAGDEQLIINNESDRYLMCQHLKYLELEKFPTFTEMELEFNCNDPFAYDITGTTNTKTVTVNGDSWAITNGGDFYALPEFTITFNQAQTHIYIENFTISGARFDISKSFSNGNILVVDCKSQRVTFNGLNSPAGFGDGGDGAYQFVPLFMGANDLRIGSDDATINVSISMHYHKVYF